MKVLLSALACQPDKGSELEVGYRAMLAAASRHQVWVLTNEDTASATRRAIDVLPCSERIHLVGIPFGVSQEEFAKLTVPGFHVHYDRWQREAGRRAQALDQQVDFDVVHHATLATYWTRAGVAAVRKPLVWGPVGGGVNPPFALLPELGARGLVEDAVRVIARRLIAQLPPASLARKAATVTFVQNEETRRRLQEAGHVVVMSNAMSAQVGHPAPELQRTSDVVFAGRLIPWKAPMLALRVLRYLETPDCVLRFCGEGPEETRLRRAAERWGLADRVVFEGWLPRKQLLDLVATAGALIHPALHEEAGLSITEALAFGTPVVVLDHGGPAQIVRAWPAASAALVPPSRPERTARAMARAIDEMLSAPPPIQDQPSTAAADEFSKNILRAYDMAVGLRGVGVSPPVDTG